MLMSFDFIIFALHDRNDAIWSMCLCVTAHWNQEAIESSEYKRVIKMAVTMVSSAFRNMKYQAFSHRFICRISFLLHHFFAFAIPLYVCVQFNNCYQKRLHQQIYAIFGRFPQHSLKPTTFSGKLICVCCWCGKSIINCYNVWSAARKNEHLIWRESSVTGAKCNKHITIIQWFQMIVTAIIKLEKRREAKNSFFHWLNQKVLECFSVCLSITRIELTEYPNRFHCTE